MKCKICRVIIFCLYINVYSVYSQSTASVTLQVIDKTKGSITSDINKIYGWVGMWAPESKTYENTGSWQANFFNGYAGGVLTKTDSEWVWSFTFDAPKGGSFAWNPYLGDTEGLALELKSHYELVVDPATNDIDFYVSKTGVVTGGTTIVFYSDYITLNDAEGNLIRKTMYDKEVVAENNFLHASGKQIVDADNHPFIIRAIGLGNYMLFEPYMIGIVNSEQTSRSDAHQAIVRSFTELAGAEHTQAFIDTYLENYFTESDVIFLKEQGFNAIRMSLHHELFIEKAGGNHAFIEKGFGYIQRVLWWCEKHQMYLIPDMHCAPGGQSEDVWSVSDAYGPGLFEGDANGTAAQYQEKYALLWSEIARRFGGSAWIGGYDLTNEINYKAWETSGQQKIRNLYNQLIAAIRLHDKKHLVFVQGNWYGNDYNGLTPPWDSNMAYCFHHYWSPNTDNAIKKALNIRDLYNVPVWMGESGENSNVWFTNAIELLEKHDIGWGWWSYKKMDDISGILSVPRPDNWNKILAYLTSEKSTPSLTKEDAQKTLMQFAENTKLQNAKVNKDVIYAIIEQPFSNGTQPFEENQIPGTIYATEYDLGRNGIAYYDIGLYGQEEIDEGTYNNGWEGRNDPVDIEKSKVQEGNGFIISSVNKGEWLNYTVYPEELGTYSLKVVYAASKNGNITVKIDDQAVIQQFDMPKTGGGSTFRTINMGDLALNKNSHTIQLYFNDPVNLSHLLFECKNPGVGNDEIMQQQYQLMVCKDYFKCTFPEPADKTVITLFDLSGRVVHKEILHVVAAGTHTLPYKSSALTPGVYFYEIKVEHTGSTVFHKSGKILVQ